MQYSKQDIAYLRLSLEDGDVATGDSAESCSITSQRQCIQAFADKYSDVPSDLVEYVDDGYSGTSMERPSMSRILQLVSMGRVRTIIVRDLSRFARNYLEAGHYLEYIFPAYDVRFISINDHYDSAKVTSGNDEAFQLAIRNLLNDLYSKDISRKIKTAVDMKKLRGEYVYGQAPYGYKKGPEKNTIVIDDYAAEIVRRIFHMAANGITVSAIAKILNEEKVMTPSMYLEKVRGKYKPSPYWSFESVKNIIVNRIYTGDTEPFKSHVIKMGSNKVRQIPYGERIVIPDTHEAIVSRETYFNARSVIKSTEKSKRDIKQPLLSGYLVCGCCGHKLTKGRTTNKNWLCASARYTDERECSHIRLNEEMMEEKLLAAVKIQCDLADVQEKTIVKKQRSINDKVDALIWEKKKLGRELDTISDQLMKTLDEYYDGNMTKDNFVTSKKKLNQREFELKERLAELEQELLEQKNPVMNQMKEEESINLIKKHSGIEKLDELIMKELVKKIVVYPNNAVQIVWNFEDLIKNSNPA